VVISAIRTGSFVAGSIGGGRSADDGNDGDDGGDTDEIDENDDDSPPSPATSTALDFLLKTIWVRAVALNEKPKNKTETLRRRVEQARGGGLMYSDTRARAGEKQNPKNRADLMV